MPNHTCKSRKSAILCGITAAIFGACTVVLTVLDPDILAIAYAGLTINYVILSMTAWQFRKTSINLCKTCQTP